MSSEFVNFVRQNFHVADQGPAEVPDSTGSNATSEQAFGSVSFHGPPQLDNFFASKYIRFDPSKLPSQQVVLELLFNHWKLSQPRLIISVTGGARRFIMHNRILYQFNRSLLRAATSADALIVTNGIWKGVTRLIGEAAQSLRYQQGSAKESRVQLLGIAAWGILQETNSLLNSNFTSPLDMKRYRVYDNFENEKVPASLDPNHHAFLLVDDGSFRKYGAEIAFRNELEDLILQQSGHDKIPGVLLVLEGGETTLTTTLEFLRKGRPVVVVDGLGGCGDLISYAYHASEGMVGEAVNSCEDFIRFDRHMVTACPHWKRYLHFKDNDAKSKAHEKMHAANVLLFEACVQRRDYVSIVQLTDADSLDSAILEANFKAARSQSDPIQLLGLAIQWNRTDIARTYVFTSENMSNPAFFGNLNSNSELFTVALKRNYYESALTLIQHGFDVAGRYLCPTVLGLMYREVLVQGGSETRFVDESLRSILNNLTGNSLDYCENEHILGVVGEVIGKMVRGHFQNIYNTLGYTDQHSALTNRGLALAALRAKGVGEKSADMVTLRKRSDQLRRTAADTMAADGNLKKLPVPYPHRDLFIFCILLNRRQLALLMWRQFSQGGALVGALFAAALLRGLASRAGSMVELAESMRKHAEFWETTASNFIEHCFERDQSHAQLLLIRAVPEFGSKTAFELAHAARLKQFMCTSCCYTKLNINWRGHMSVTTPISLIMATTFFPFLLPLIKFRPGFEHESNYHWSKVGAFMDVEVLDTVGIEQTPPAPSALRRVALRSSSTRIGLPRALLLFYTAPVTKYITNALSYVIYLTLFSLFLLTDLYVPNAITPTEVVLWIWTLVMILEESRQIIMSNGSLKLRFQFFWSNWWHRIDCLAYVLFVTASLCHIFQVAIENGQVQEANPPETLSSLAIASIDLYNLALMLFFIRLLSFFYVSQVLGPKVITLFRMMVDVGFFFAIYIVLLLAFSVPIQSLLYPGSKFTWELFEVIFYNFILILFQMSDPEPKIRGRTDSYECIAFNASDPTTFAENVAISQRCPRQNYLAVALLCAFLVSTSIVLLNLLIVMFGFTFNNVASVSAAVWRFNMYEFVLGYYNKSALAPPLSLLEQIATLVASLASKIVKKQADDDHDDDGANGGGASTGKRRNSPFVLYEDDVAMAALNGTKKDSFVLRRRAYQMGMLVRFETSSIETFFEEQYRNGDKLNLGDEFGNA